MPRLDLPTLANGGMLLLLVAVVLGLLFVGLSEGAQAIDGEDRSVTGGEEA